MCNRPLLSIIIPTFNSSSTLTDTLNSIFSQSFENLEVLIIDGLSTDNTLEIVEEFKNKYTNIFVHSDKDENVYDAMNKGVKRSKGEFLYFMGSDDVFYNNEVIEFFLSTKNREVDFIYGNVEFKQSKQVYSGESNLDKLVKKQISICHQAIFYSKKVFEVVGTYNLKYFIHADYDFNIRCFENKNIKTKYIDLIVSIFNERGLSGTQSNADGFHTDLTESNILESHSVIELHIQKEELEKKINLIYNSKEYKLGLLIFKPVTKLKRLCKSIMRYVR